jgi:hypothetical protein
MADVYLNPEINNTDLGTSVSPAGDVNGDGYSDVIVGAPNAEMSKGKAYIYYGGTGGARQPDVRLFQNISGDHLGRVVASAGDFNGDGYDDVLVGSPYNNANGSFAGKVTLYFGGAQMDTVEDVSFHGATFNSYFGEAIRSAGDINKDGYGDIIIGRAYAGLNEGMAYVYYGGPIPNNVPDLTFSNIGTIHSVSGISDVNGDGWDDIIIGASRQDLERAVIYFGGASMDNTPDVILSGANANDLFGWQSSSAGDFNGDGLPDIIIGAAGNDAGGTSAGRAYLYLSSPPRGETGPARRCRRAERSGRKSDNQVHPEQL